MKNDCLKLNLPLVACLYTVEPVSSGTTLIGLPVLSSQLSKSWNSFCLNTAIFTSIKPSPPSLSSHGHPWLSPNGLLVYCLPLVLNDHLQWNHSNKAKKIFQMYLIHVCLRKSMLNFIFQQGFVHLVVNYPWG